MSKIVKEYPPDRRITIAMPFKEQLGIPQINRNCHQMFMDMCEATARIGYEVFTNTETTTSNTPITRTILVNKMKGDWILMMDADAFPGNADVGVRLLAAARHDPKNIKKVVATAGVRQSYPFMATFGYFNPEGLSIPWRYGIDYGDKEVDATEMCVREVEHTGFNCILFHRSVFDIVPYPWFPLNIPDLDSGIIYGHDITFCREARRRGVKVYIDFSAKVGHMAMKPMTIADNRALVQTNPVIKEKMRQLEVDVEAMCDADETQRLQYLIPRKKGDQDLKSGIIIPPEELVLPKEALK